MLVWDHEGCWMVFHVFASDMRMLHHWLARVLPAEASISSAPYLMCTVQFCQRLLTAAFVYSC